MQLKASNVLQKMCLLDSSLLISSVGGAQLQGVYACEGDVDVVKGMETWCMSQFLPDCI